MDTPIERTLEDVAKRNAAIDPVRVRKMQEIVRQLQDRGVLTPSKYGIHPALGDGQHGLATARVLKMMNRADDAPASG